MCLYLPSLEINFSYLISFMEAQKTPSQEHSLFLSSLHPRIELCVDIFSYIYHVFFFSPQLVPQTVPRQHYTMHESFFVVDTIVFFSFSKINSSIASEWVFYQLAFAGKVFSCLIQNNDFFHLSRGLLINATSGVTTFSGVCFRGTRGLSEILAKLNHNQRENVSNQNYTLGFNLLPWKSQGWHFYSIFRYSQMGCSLQDNFCRPSAFSQGNKAAKSSKSKSEASI